MSHASHRRRSTAYIIVLGTTLLVTVIGLSAVTMVRIQRRSAQNEGDFAKARFYARSAIEMGMLIIADEEDWRRRAGGTLWADHLALGDGEFSLEVTDPDDGDVSDSDTDPVVLTGTGYKNDARYALEVTVEPVIEPLEALGTCLHVAGDAEVKGGDVLEVSGAPLAVNGNLHNDGFIYGDVEAGSISKWDVITGTVTVPASPRDPPDPGVIEMYAGLATTIPFLGDLDDMVLAPGLNRYSGATDSDGLYYLNTSNHDITIKHSRIHGTLIVDVGPDKKVTIQDQVLMEPYRSDYPVLIVIGNAEIKHKSGSELLSEDDRSTNFNPPGAPYEGVADDDLVDEYPNEIRGLVHVTGALTLKETARFDGVVLCQTAVIDGSWNHIVHDPDLYENPPLGYTQVVGMAVVPGSWTRTVD